MYPDLGLMFHFSQGFRPESAAPMICHNLLRPPPPDEELLGRFNIDFSADASQMGNLVRTNTVSEYDLGGEGDLFKAPEPIIGEQSILALDPMTAEISIMSGDNVISETIKVAGVEPIQEDLLLSDVFYECKQDLLEKSAIEEAICEPSHDVKVLTVQSEEPSGEKVRLVAEELLPKNMTGGCLNSMEWVNGCTVRPNFLGFQGLDFDASSGMRRAFSEGDIQALGNNSFNLGNTGTTYSSFEHLSTINDNKAEDRRQRLLRYRKKKSMRNFGRKIKYACRKALADNQLRVRGRFAKTEECEISKRHH